MQILKLLSAIFHAQDKIGVHFELFHPNCNANKGIVKKCFDG